MTCPRHDILVALGDGELPESQARSVRAHASGCTRCKSELAELAAIADDLRAPVPGALGLRSAEDFADEVLAKLGAPRTGPRDRRLPRWVGVLAAAAVLPLAVTAAHRFAQAPRATGEWTARGVPRAPAAMRTLVTFGRVSGTTFEPLADGARLEADALLAAEIAGTEGPPRYLLAFLIDGSGERHWIYPSYEPGAPPPSSIALPVSVAPRVLGSMVRLDRPAPGRARLVAVVLERSETVDYVEQAPLDKLSSEELEAHYRGALVVTTSVEIP